jgi:hypothetical protein
MRCAVRDAWSSKLCWECHRAYAASLRTDPQGSRPMVRGIVVGIVTVLVAMIAGAPAIIALAALPIATLTASYGSRMYRRRWIERTGVLPEARLLAGKRPE